MFVSTVALRTDFAAVQAPYVTVAIVDARYLSGEGRRWVYRRARQDRKHHRLDRHPVALSIADRRERVAVGVLVPQMSRGIGNYQYDVQDGHVSRMAGMTEMGRKADGRLSRGRVLIAVTRPSREVRQQT